MQELYKVPNSDYGQLQAGVDQPDPNQPTTDPTEPKGIERALYGKVSLGLRNICGVLSVLTVCMVAVFNAWTTNKSVTDGKGWPSDWVIVTVNVGPIICAWAYLSANKVLTAILQAGGDGESISTRIRRRIADTVDPDGRPSNNNNNNNNNPPPPMQ